jgi:hypothetical protein
LHSINFRYVLALVGGCISTNISEIILAFDGWGKPWTFHESIIKSLGLSPKLKNLFDEIWNNANSEEFWLSAPNLQIAVTEVTRRLASSYPELTNEAASAIARAVSYQWR